MAGRLADPAPEGVIERADFGVAERKGDFRQRQSLVFQEVRRVCAGSKAEVAGFPRGSRPRLVDLPAAAPIGSYGTCNGRAPTPKVGWTERAGQILTRDARIRCPLP